MLHLRALREGERFLYVDAKIDSAFYLRAAEQRRASVQHEGRPEMKASQVEARHWRSDKEQSDMLAGGDSNQASA